jgi:hypothetical protein
MSSNFVPNSGIAYAPSPAPSLDDAIDMVLALPDDGDNMNVSSILQAFKVLGGWTTFLKKALSPYRGTRLWNSVTTYTEGMSVLNPSDSRIYRALSESTDFVPTSNPGVWQRCDYANDEIQMIAAKVTQAVSGVTCSNGASVASLDMVGFGQGAVKVIMMVVQGVPLDNYTQVDFSGSTVKFSSYCRGAVLSLMSEWFSYPATVGYNALSANAFQLWAKKVGASPDSACQVGVLLWGE